MQGHQGPAGTHPRSLLTGEGAKGMVVHLGEILRRRALGVAQGLPTPGCTLGLLLMHWQLCGSDPQLSALDLGPCSSHTGERGPDT